MSLEEHQYGGQNKSLWKCTTSAPVKVTVQFETEGNGQNEIFSRMDRSEVKL